MSDDARVERLARDIASWHGSAMSHSNSDGEMQTVASSYVGHRWSRASTEYADKKWQQYRLAAKCVIEMMNAEREACAKIAETWGERKDEMTDTAFAPGADHGERFASSGIAELIRNRASEI